jgi:cytochrome c556
MDPATIALILGSTLFSGIFGESEAKKRERKLQEYLDMIKPEFQYWSGQARGINPMVLEAIKAQMARYQGFGWPEGGGI